MCFFFIYLDHSPPPQMINGRPHMKIHGRNYQPPGTPALFYLKALDYLYIINLKHYLNVRISLTVC